MRTFVFLMVLAGIVNIVVGSYVLYLNPKAKLNRLYCLFAWSTVIWSMADMLALTSDTPTRALRMDAISTMGSTFAAAFLIHYFLIFAKKKFVLDKTRAALLYLPALFFTSVAAISPTLINVAAEPVTWGYRLIPGPLYPPLAVYMTAVFLLDIVICRRFYRETTAPNERSQARALLTIMTISVLTAIMFDDVWPLLGLQPLPPMSSSISTVVAMGVAFVIRKYGLMAITPAMAATKIIETMNDYLVVLDRLGNISFVNDATLNLFGKKMGELVGRPLGELSPQLDGVFQALADKDSVKEYETEVADKTGKLVPVSVNGSALRGQRGETAGLVLVVRDISQLRHQMTIIENQRQRIAAILESIGDGVFVIDPEGKIVLTNPAARQMAGKKEDEVLAGRHFYEIFSFVAGPRLEPAGNFIIEAMTKKVVTYAPIQTDLITAEGEKLPVAVSAAPLVGPTGVTVGVVGIIRDDHREREIDQIKSDFVTITSHELKSPLTAIRWLIESVLGDKKGNLTSEQKESLNSALLSDLRMLSLVKDMLNVSRLESGRGAVTPSPTNLDQFCAGAVIDIQPLADEKQIKIKNEAVGLGILNIDARLVNQALTNLLSNAIKYSRPGGIVTLSGARRSDDALISIKDDGIGIPEKQQKNIFGKFFRADNASAFGAEGSGLGLFVVKSIVESSGGRIWFESIENRGTTFNFTLPLAGSRPLTGDRGLEAANL